MKYPEIWFRGLSDKEKKETENTLKHHVILKRLLEIIEQFEKEASPKEADYNNPSWPYFQADNLGYLRALQKVKRLFSDQER